MPAGLYLLSALPELTTDAFWAWAASALVVCLAVSQLSLRRKLWQLRAFTPANRAAAIAEARQFCAHAGRHSAGVWVASMLLVAGLLRASANLPWHLVTRLSLSGLLFAPIALTLVNLLTARRSLWVVEALVLGGPAPGPEVAARHRSDETRVRLVLFTVIMVALPSIMLADIARAAIEHLIDSESPSQLAAHSQLALTMVAFTLSALGMALLAAWAGASAIALPLQRVVAQSAALAQGRTDTADFIAAEGEVGLVTDVFARLKQRLVEVLRQMHRAGGEIDSATAVLRVTARQYEAGSMEQAAALNKTSSTTETLALGAKQISRSASEVQDLAQKTLEAADAGRARAEALQVSVERMSEDNALITVAVERLQLRVMQIGSIIESINGIARHNDGLASQAELQGARAGDLGRSFTLVAAEMRRHVQNTLESTDEVEALIAEIRDATKKTAEATQVSAFLTFNSNALAAEVASSLKTVALLARETSNAVSVISLATRQQESGTDDLAEAMADILGVTQQVLGTTQQLAVANEQLRALSMNLSSVVESLA